MIFFFSNSIEYVFTAVYTSQHKLKTDIRFICLDTGCRLEWWLIAADDERASLHESEPIKKC